MVILEQDIDRFDTIPSISNIPKLFYVENPEDYIKLSFFKNWIVGFTTAEGSFFIKSNNDACFLLKQIIDPRRGLPSGWAQPSTSLF